MLETREIDAISLEFYKLLTENLPDSDNTDWSYVHINQQIGSSPANMLLFAHEVAMRLFNVNVRRDRKFDKAIIKETWQKIAKNLNNYHGIRAQDVHSRVKVYWACLLRLHASFHTAEKLNKFTESDIEALDAMKQALEVDALAYRNATKKQVLDTLSKHGGNNGMPL